MQTRALTGPTSIPSLFEDFFRPLSEWFDDSRLISRVNTLPAVNVKEKSDHYTVTMAAPGLKKDDFKIEVENNMLIIGSEKEEKNEVEDEKFTRKEYSYSSFTRSFNLPDDVKQDQIDARYEDGVLKITLPRKGEVKKTTATKMIAVK